VVLCLVHEDGLFLKDLIDAHPIELYLIESFALPEQPTPSVAHVVHHSTQVSQERLNDFDLVQV
jgi:hypothetical protein